MPRKDRRFTGSDVRRFYCRNLTVPQQEIFEYLYSLGCDRDDKPVESTLEGFLPYLGYAVAFVSVGLLFRLIEPIAIALIQRGQAVSLERMLRDLGN